MIAQSKRALFVLLAILLSVFATGRSSGQTTQPHTESARCPPGAIAILPGASIQDAVDKAGVNAAFCFKKGIHRAQAIRPLRGQRFYGEEHAILNGARIVTAFQKEGGYWSAPYNDGYERRHGECAKGHEMCNFPLRVFIDDKPLRRAPSRKEVKPGWAFLDNQEGKLFIADDPAGRTVELTVARFAFRSAAPDVLIKDLTVEKYANPSQNGAINGEGGSNWRVEECEVRLNSGAGVSVGQGGSIIASNIHHNGQIGAVMVGRKLALKNNEIWANNIYDFDYRWEAGGVKIAESSDVLIKNNFAHHNNGPGLWCDINCRDVIYENNKVEYNNDAGIFHEISYKAIIRNNTVRFNGLDRGWYWGAEIQIAASENVEVYGNAISVGVGGRGIMLIDQSRNKDDGGKYKTRGNYIHDNEVHFEGAGKIGGVSDAKPGDENYSIIETGGNRFDGNVYDVPPSNPVIEFAWGHASYDWDGFRKIGQEKNGRETINNSPAAQAN